MKIQHYLKSFEFALTTAILMIALVFAGFVIIEPKVGHTQSAVGIPFTIKQTIGDEISFLVQAANATTSGTINGMTGGEANGSTTAVVLTNSPTGYNMEIAFFDNGTGNAMLSDVWGSESILDYPSSGGEPTFLFATTGPSAVFGYTVSAYDSSDLDPSFLDNGSACNTGSGYTVNRCWMEPTVAGFRIIDRDTAALSGATTTLHFKIYVPNGPTPSLVADVYTATATLTAINH